MNSGILAVFQTDELQALQLLRVSAAAAADIFSWPKNWLWKIPGGSALLAKTIHGGIVAFFQDDFVRFLNKVNFRFSGLTGPIQRCQKISHASIFPFS
jgi:hypothetical protein